MFLNKFKFLFILLLCLNALPAHAIEFFDLDSQKCGNQKVCIHTNANSGMKIICPSVKGECPEINDCLKKMINSSEVIYTPIYVYVDKDKSPVEGANIIEHQTNTFLGKTNKEGKFDLYAKEGVIIRIAEPSYGLQTHVFTVKANSDKAPHGARMLVGDGGLAGWTLP